MAAAHQATRVNPAPGEEGGGVWPLQDIVITNIVWCIAYIWEVGRGVLYCPIIVQ